jgi:hypothetical protein
MPPPPPPPPPGGFVPPPPMPGGYPPAGAGSAGPRTDGLAIASLIAGILSLPCSFICLGVILGPTAAIMGFISRQRISSSGGSVGGGGMALAGLILGVIGFILSVIAFFIWIAAFITSSGLSSASPT